MKNYQNLEIAVIVFDNADIITNSSSNDNVVGPGDDWGGM